MAKTSEETFLGYLDDLSGKVAFVTGGAGTIGSQAAAYLAARGCLVYVADTASRLAALSVERPKADWGFFAGAGARVEGEYPDRLRQHVLDLSSIGAAEESAAEFLAREQRLDIVIASAATMEMPQNRLSPDGWERTWAIAHLGHVALINQFLRCKVIRSHPALLRKSANPSRPSRVVFISSNSYESAAPPDYELLQKLLPDDFETPGFLRRGAARYQVSKLANLYYTQELTERLSMDEAENEGRVSILVNCSHPGVNGRTHLGTAIFSPWMESLIKGVVALLSHTPRDCAKTGVYMAAAADIRLRRVTGEFWTPRWSWLGYWTGCYRAEITPLGKDVPRRKECWEVTNQAIAAAKVRMQSGEGATKGEDMDESG